MNDGFALKRLAAAVTAIVGAAYLSTFFFHSDAAIVDWGTDLIPIIVPIIAAIACVVTARKAPASARATWLFLAAGAASWAAGDVAWTTLNRLGTYPPGSFTLADVGYLGLIPAWCAALLVHPIRHARRTQILRGTIDAATAVAIAATVVAAYVLAPILADRGEDVVGSIVLLAYPVGDLALISLLFAIAMRTEAPFRRTEVFLGLAVATFTIGDIVYARLGIIGAYEVGNPVDLTWVFAFVFLAIASRHQLAETPVVRRPRESLISPIAAFAFISLAALVGLGFLSHEHIILLLGAALVSTLISIRFALQAAENRGLLAELGATIEELESAVAAKDEFVAAASHQLRTPLTSIRLRVDELQANGIASPLSRRYLDEVAGEVARLNSLTVRLLALLSADAPQESTSIAVGPAVGEAVRCVLPLAERRGVRIEADKVPETLAVAGRPGALEEVLVNLIDNGVKFTPDGGVVTVTVSTNHSSVELRVENDGRRIDPEAAARAFEPFWRAPGAPPGTGLGLAVVKRVCDTAGASVALEAGAEGGTVARVVWPRGSGA